MKLTGPAGHREVIAAWAELYPIPAWGLLDHQEARLAALLGPEDTTQQGRARRSRAIAEAWSDGIVRMLEENGYRIVPDGRTP